MHTQVTPFSFNFLIWKLVKIFLLNVFPPVGWRGKLGRNCLRSNFSRFNVTLKWSHHRRPTNSQNQQTTYITNQQKFCREKEICKDLKLNLLWCSFQTSKGAGHISFPSNCAECRSRILQNLKIKTLVERGLVLAVEVYILRGQTLNWIPELQLCQIPTQTFYLNWNCEEQRFHNTNRNFHILFKTKLEMGAFLYRDRCCNWVSKCWVNTKEHFGKDITVAFMGATQIQQQTLK